MSSCPLNSPYAEGEVPGIPLDELKYFAIVAAQTLLLRTVARLAIDQQQCQTLASELELQQEQRFSLLCLSQIFLGYGEQTYATVVDRVMRFQSVLPEEEPLVVLTVPGSRETENDCQVVAFVESADDIGMLIATLSAHDGLSGITLSCYLDHKFMKSESHAWEDVHCVILVDPHERMHTNGRPHGSLDGMSVFVMGERNFNVARLMQYLQDLPPF